MRLGVIGIVIQKNREIADEVNGILSSFGDDIIGRMGVPNKEEGIFVISVIVKSSNERISALTGKLGRLNNVKVKSAITDVEV